MENFSFMEIIQNFPMVLKGTPGLMRSPGMADINQSDNCLCPSLYRASSSTRFNFLGSPDYS